MVICSLTSFLDVTNCSVAHVSDKNAVNVQVSIGKLQYFAGRVSLSVSAYPKKDKILRFLPDLHPDTIVLSIGSLL